MKYLKNFEHTIKHSDPIAVNHPLNIFSRKLEDNIIDLKNYDKLKNSTVRRYFIDNGDISIVYSKNGTKLLKMNIKNDSKYLYLNAITSISNWNKSDTVNSREYSKFMGEQFYSFEINTKYTKNQYLYQEYKFEISESYKIIEKTSIDNFLIYLHKVDTLNKYNL